MSSTPPPPLSLALHTSHENKILEQIKQNMNKRLCCCVRLLMRAIYLKYLKYTIIDLFVNIKKLTCHIILAQLSQLPYCYTRW